MDTNYRCPNCDQPLTAAPYRLDDDEHGVHWQCPTGDEHEYVYAPVALTDAIFEYLNQPHIAQSRPERRALPQRWVG